MGINHLGAPPAGFSNPILPHAPRILFPYKNKCIPKRGLNRDPSCVSEWVCVCFKQLQSVPLHQLKMQFRSPFSCSEEIWFKLPFPPYQNNNNKKFNLFSFRCLLFPTKGNSAAALSHHLIARGEGGLSFSRLWCTHYKKHVPILFDPLDHLSCPAPSCASL